MLTEQGVLVVATWVVTVTVPLYLIAGGCFILARDWGRGVAFISWGIANGALVWGGGRGDLG